MAHDPSIQWLPGQRWERTVVLLSGGIDSAVMLHQVHGSGRTLPVFIDYGQRSLQPERAAAEWQCRALGLDLVTLDVSGIGDTIYAGAASRPHTPLPERNLVITSVALSYAVATRASAVAVGIIRDDLAAYSGTTASFWYAFRDLAATLGSVAIETPLIYFDKAGVVSEGQSLGVDFAHTYSCTVGHALHCGRCRQCLARRAAAGKNGLVEAAGFYAREALAS